MPLSNTAKDASGTFYWILIDADGRQVVTDRWSPELQVDEAANDSDKSFAVDAGEEWYIESIWVELVTTANAGNREMVVEIQDDSADVIARVKAGVVQAASLTRYYLFSHNVTELTAFRGTAAADLLTTIMPRWYLPATYIIRVYDIAAVDAAADDMAVQMLITKRTVT